MGLMMFLGFGGPLAIVALIIAIAAAYRIFGYTVDTMRERRDWKRIENGQEPVYHSRAWYIR